MRASAPKHAAKSKKLAVMPAYSPNDLPACKWMSNENTHPSTKLA
jgi:hypothetical protein